MEIINVVQTIKEVHKYEIILEKIRKVIKYMEKF